MNLSLLSGNTDESFEGRAQTDEEIRNARYTPAIPLELIFVFDGVIDGFRGGVLPGSVTFRDIDGNPMTAEVHLTMRNPIQMVIVSNAGETPQFTVP